MEVIENDNITTTVNTTNFIFLPIVFFVNIIHSD